MTYYSDLSPFCYLDGEPNTLNIGWLDGTHPYPQGHASEQLIARLWVFCQERVNQMRGFHQCQLCHEPAFGIACSVATKSFGLARPRCVSLAPLAPPTPRRI